MSKVIVRYIWPEVGDGFLCPQPYTETCIWISGNNGGMKKARRFDSVEWAAAYLMDHKYQLPAEKFRFETVED
jgi:hypothetical protein